MINPDLLKEYGGVTLNLQKGETIFEENGVPRYFFIVEKGEVKMNNYNEDGKEFIQGIFSQGRSFGEPPLFTNHKYPANAITTEESIILKLKKDRFFQLLKEHSDIHLAITSILAERLFYKASMVSQIASHHPQNSILKLLNYLKFEVYKIEKAFAYEVELTRQQIADLTGLRTETVIKTIKEMEKDGILQIKNRKVYL